MSQPASVCWLSCSEDACCRCCCRRCRCRCRCRHTAAAAAAGAGVGCGANKLSAEHAPQHILARARVVAAVLLAPAADASHCLAALSSLLQIVFDDAAFRPLQLGAASGGGGGSDTQMWEVVRLLLLDTSPSMASSEVLAALARHGDDSTAAGRSAAAAGSGGGGSGSGSGARAAGDAQWNAIWLLSIVGVASSPLFATLLHQHLHSSGGLAALLQAAEQVLQQVPLGAGACAIDRSTRAGLARNAVTLLGAVIDPLARVQPLPGDQPAAAVRHTAAAEALHLLPLVLVSLRHTAAGRARGGGASW